MFFSVLEPYKIWIWLSSSHTMSPMIAVEKILGCTRKYIPVHECNSNTYIRYIFKGIIS